MGFQVAPESVLCCKHPLSSAMVKIVPLLLDAIIFQVMGGLIWLAISGIVAVDQLAPLSIDLQIRKEKLQTLK